MRALTTVLIVSTDSPTATLLGAFAEVEGYDVQIHDDARETPDLAIRRARPHLILLETQELGHGTTVRLFLPRA